MIACRDVMEQIAELAPANLAGEVGESLRQHLAGCAACREYLEACQLAAHLGGRPMPHPPHHLKAALEEGGAGEPAR